MKRDECLERAKQCVCGQRQTDYGKPERNFELIADFWTSYINAKYFDVITLSPEDVAVMMGLMKIARIASGTGTEDSFIDLAGYAACGCEILSEEVEE